MELTEELKKRFCKNCNIPISIFIEPFFTDRILLYDKYFGTIEKLNKFKESIKAYRNEQEYYEHYNKVKDEAITFIKGTDGYNVFNTMDMDGISMSLANYNFPSSSIYKPTNDGKYFISIDMRQANFHSLKDFSPEIFDNAETWEDFMRKFTDDEHIIESKYVRQVILGNCNPKRHITYEKYLMSFILFALAGYVSKKDIVCYTNDEIVIQTDENNKYNIEIIAKIVHEIPGVAKIPFKIETFELEYMGEDVGYIKKYSNGEFKLKCVDNDYFPIILRLMESGIIQTSDMFFMHKGVISRFVNIPDCIRNAFNYTDSIYDQKPISMIFKEIEESTEMKSYEKWRANNGTIHETIPNDIYELFKPKENRKE